MDDPLDIQDVWKFTDELKVGQLISFLWRDPSKRNARWKSRSALVLKTSTAGATGIDRCASVRYSDFGSNAGHAFPEDGQHTKLLLAYRDLEAEDADAHTPTPPRKKELPADLQARLEEQRKAEAPKPKAKQVPESSDSDDDSDTDDSEEEEAEEEEDPIPTDFSLHNACLDPKQWHYIVRNDFTLLEARIWFQDYFAKALQYHVAAEALFVKSILSALQGQLLAVKDCPQIVRSPHWVKSVQDLLVRLLLMLDRANGASSEQLTALTRGYEDRSNPEWIQEMRSNAVKLLTTSNPLDVSRTGAKKGNAGKRKNGRKNKGGTSNTTTTADSQ